MMSAITSEQAHSGRCPHCGSDFVDSDREMNQPNWTCFDCGAIWWKVQSSTSLPSSEDMSVMTLDELTRMCGFFSTESNVNNGYNCLHPDNEDPEYDEVLKKDIGKCIHFYCPIAWNMEEEGFEGWSGDHRMKIRSSEEKETEGND